MNNAILQRFDLAEGRPSSPAAGARCAAPWPMRLGAMGVKVAVLDISLEKAETRAQAVIRSGGTARAFECDVLDPAQLRECCEAISAVWGTPDLLINGAGGNDPGAAPPSNSTNPPDRAAGGPVVLRSGSRRFPPRVRSQFHGDVSHDPGLCPRDGREGQGVHRQHLFDERLHAAHQGGRLFGRQGGGEQLHAVAGGPFLPCRRPRERAGAGFLHDRAAQVPPYRSARRASSCPAPAR